MKKLIAIVLVLMLVLSLASCGSKGSSEPAPAADGGSSSGSETKPDSGKDSQSGEKQPDAGGDSGASSDRVIRIATNGDTGTLYPLAAAGGFVSVDFAFYEPLWFFDQNGEKIWKLAESYEQVGEQEFTLKVRPNVTFSNGNPLTADDILFTMEMCKDDPRFNLNVSYVDFEKTKVVDDLTLDVWYTVPTYTQENSFTQLMVMDKESFDMESLSRSPIGTGPYICTDYVVNSHVTCVANPNYWGGEPAIKNLEFKVINETSQIVNALEVGDVDLVNSVPVDEIDYIESLGYTINTQPGRYCQTALYSFAGALGTKEARYAVSYAMDRESIAYLMYKGISSVPGFPASELSMDYEERFSGMHDTYTTGYNVEKAKEYADKSGLTGKTLKIITNGSEMYNDTAAIIKENLAAIGVNSEIVSYDSATYFSVIMDETNYDIALFFLSSPSMLCCDTICAYLDFISLGWHDEIRDQYEVVHQQIVSTVDPVQRGEYTYEALKIFVDVDPWYAMCEAMTANAQSNDLGGVAYTLSGTVAYEDLYWK